MARADGREIIPMSSGDPQLATDPRIIAAAERALHDGATHYSSSAGEGALREAIALRECERSGVRYATDDVIVTPGGKFALLTALMGVVGPGDEVLIPQPSWVSYGPCVRLCGATPVPVPMLDAFDVEAVERVVRPATRAIIVNSPVNPTGRVYSSAEVASLVAFAERFNLWIIFDQVYADLVFNGAVTYPQATGTAQERTLVVDSFSKSFGMTGWRLGYLAMPAGLSASVVKFIQHSVYCVPAFIQAAGREALALSGDLLPKFRDVFRRRIARAVEALALVGGIECQAPDAGFFLFPAVAGDDQVVAKRLLDELDIAVLAGSAFGASGAGHLRMSLSCTDQELDLALERMKSSGVFGE